MSAEKIRKAIKSISKTTDETFCTVATVDSVDLVENTCLCLPLDSSKADLMNVRLIADNKTGLLIIPKTGSVVVVSFISNELYYVSMFSEVDKIILAGNDYGGLVKVADLTTAINTKLTNLKTAITTALTSIDASIVALGGASTAGATFSATVAATVTPLVRTQYESQIVYHGSSN